MAYSHRQGDGRICGASTIVSGQSFVTIEGNLWAVDGDGNSHGGGGLGTSNGWVTIEDKGIIVAGDTAAPDGLCPIPPHCEPSAVGFSDLVIVE